MDEILLRIPPDEPAHLVRAALVCKPWLRVVSDPAFRRGYRERHRRPPLLGFIHNLYDDKGPILRFVPTAACPCSPPAFGYLSWCALDSRHGRVLVETYGPTGLVVWNPVTGDKQRVPLPPYSSLYYTGAVLCAAANCDHLDCAGGPFLVVFMSTTTGERVTWAALYSSETRGWSAKTTADVSTSTVDPHSYMEIKPSILIGGALYFTLELHKVILKYDLARQGLSVMDASEVYERMGIAIIT